jgi:hypothetical protein
MTLTEASRQVEGAGSWLDEAGPQAFRVRGVLSTDIFSLYFDFQDRADITLEGFFVANDRLTGELVGGEFDGVRVTFQRTGG